MGALALHQQAAGVVAQVVLPSLVLLVSTKHQVVIARLKEQAMLRVASFEGLLRLSRNRLWSNQPPIVPPATDLEATHHRA